jgi:hypothetical protein
MGSRMTVSLRAPRLPAVVGLDGPVVLGEVEPRLGLWTEAFGRRIQHGGLALAMVHGGQCPCDWTVDH